MPGLKKHIAILLLGIFFFPLAYQPYHVLKHHSLKALCNQACCHSHTENKDCNNNVQFNSASKGPEHCPICEYHFPINVIPKLNLFKPKNSFRKYNLFGLEERLAFQQTSSKKSPRAPPFLIFS